MADAQPQTSTGQDFTHIFAGSPTNSDGSGGTITFYVGGDIHPLSASEMFTFDIEGITGGPIGPFSPGVYAQVGGGNHQGLRIDDGVVKDC